MASCSATAPPHRAADDRSSVPVLSSSALAPVASASSASSQPGPEPDGPTLMIVPTDFDFSKNPDAIARIASSPHHFYRFINQRFSALVCHRFAERIKTMPRVALHGDAHVEQYAATDLGRGLTDLDDTATGPPIVDLLRMGTSLVVSVHEKAVDHDAFKGRESDVLQELYRGYRQGIAEPAKIPEPSAFDKRLQKKFSKQRKAFLDLSEKNILPFASPEDQKEAEELHDTYEKEMLRINMYGPKNKAFPAGTFKVKKIGPINLGIGSALDRRFLMRLEGRTSASDDDLIVEIKREREPADPVCLTALRDYQPRRYLVGEALERYFDPIVVPGKPYWAGEWYLNYKDVKIDKSIESIDDLKSIAFESGFVLGRGHVTSLVNATSPVSAEVESAAKKALSPSDPYEIELSATSVVLAGEVERGFERFRQAANLH